MLDNRSIMNIIFMYKGKEISENELEELTRPKNTCAYCKSNYTKFEFHPYEERKFTCQLCNTHDLCTNCVFYCYKCKKTICTNCASEMKCKGCKESFCKKHINSKCESCHTADYCHDCLYKTKFQCIDCFAERFQEKDRIRWNEIDPNNPVNLPNKVVLCTNNIEATVNDGTMSHVWVAKLKKVKLSKEYSEAYRIDGVKSVDYYGIGDIMHIDYWAELRGGLKVDHTGCQIENLKLLGSKKSGYYSVNIRNI